MLDFRSSQVLGALSCVIEAPDKDGDIMRYLVTGAFRDQRLILFWKAEDSDEPCKVDVFPFMGESLHNIQYGVSCLRTWDGTESLSAVIMSRRPIPNTDGAERITDKDVAKSLSNKWTTEFKRLLSLFPMPDC